MPTDRARGIVRLIVTTNINGTSLLRRLGTNKVRRMLFVVRIVERMNRRSRIRMRTLLRRRTNQRRKDGMMLRTNQLRMKKWRRLLWANATGVFWRR